MRNISLFLILSFSISILGYVSKEILNIDDLLINSLLEKLTQEQVLESLKLQQKFQWIGFMFIPVMLFLKIIVIAFIIDSGCFFFDKDIKYRKIFNIVVKAEFIFLLVIVFKTLWFYVFHQDYTLEDTKGYNLGLFTRCKF